MKSSPSSNITIISTSRPFVYITIFFLLISRIPLSTASSPHEAPLAHLCNHHHFFHHHHQPHEGNSLSSSHRLPSRCLHFARRRFQPPPREIDPRYGVEKRLVPTGPNPLHN
ncbi:hypothetical protein COCNU_05G002250 [Cocos nucifera]|uniref:CLAVATA3/ESR (CLE)-related protein 9 n=1 Tax=Cocos nucifera TaxID=13894 RepID=A0A8K0N1Q1_COCNU|nr:hypothetical protein COCNU_05G002250 [Cocos nucifera]